MKKSFQNIYKLIKMSDVSGLSFIGLVFLGVISSLFNILPISYLKKISDQLFLLLESKSYEVRKIIIFFIIYLIIIIAGTVIRNVFCYFSSKYSNRVIYSIRKLANNKLLLVDYKYIHKSDKGKIINTVYNNTARLEVIFSTALFTLISDLLDLLWISFFISSISIWVLVFLIIGLPLLLYFALCSGQYQKKLATKRIDEEKNMINNITQTFINLDTIRVFSGEKREAEYFENHNRGYYKTSNTADKSLSSFYVIQKTIRSLAICVSLGYISIGILSNNISFGSLLAISMYAERFYSPVANVVRYYQMIQKGLASVDDLDNFFSEDNFVKNRNVTFNKKSDWITVNNISVKDNKSILLKNFSCKIIDKKINIVSGQSGIGKTTFIKSLLGIHQLSEGGFFLNEKLKNSKNIFSYASQDIELYNGTVLENVIYPDSLETVSQDKMSRATKLLKKAGISDSKLIQSVGEDGSEISGGEKKRIALVRAILSESDIIILDEITSNLDRKYKNKIEDLIIDISKDKCIILITHDISNKLLASKNYNLIKLERR